MALDRKPLLVLRWVGKNVHVSEDMTRRDRMAPGRFHDLDQKEHLEKNWRQEAEARTSARPQDFQDVWMRRATETPIWQRR